MISTAPPYRYPCRYCDDRCVQPNCHCTCERYLEIVAKNEEYKKEERFKQVYKAYKQNLMDKLNKNR